MPHPCAAGRLPVLLAGDGAERVRHRVAHRIGFPAAVLRRVAGRRHRTPVDETRAAAGQPRGGANGAPQGHDARAAVRGQVPEIGQGERHQLTRVELVKDLLLAPRDAAEQPVDDNPVNARVGAGAERGMPAARRGRQRVHAGAGEPRALGAQPRQHRHHVAVGLEIVGAHAVEHDHRDHARARRVRLNGLLEHAARGRRAGPHRQEPRQRGGDVLLHHRIGPGSLPDESGAMEQQRNVRVVLPGRPVDEHLEIIACVDDKVALVRHVEYLPAAPRKVAAREHVEPLLAPIRRGRRGTRVAGRRSRRWRRAARD